MADAVNNVIFRLTTKVEGEDGTRKLADGIADADEGFKRAQNSATDFEKKVAGAGRTTSRTADDMRTGGARVKQLGAEAEVAGKKVEGLGNRISSSAKAFLAFAGVDATVRGAIALVSSGFGTIRDFEQEVAALSSITGATGGDLEFLKDQAKEVATVSTVSAIDAVRAFKAIGSARPDLLANKEALAAVTKEAIALSEAAEINLADAGSAVAAAMNQFGLGADQAARIVNVLAAGSLEGAADVNLLRDSIGKVGTVMAANNINLETGTALIETLAEKNIQGAEAGTQLRNVILRLATSGKGFVDGQFDMVAALEQTKAELDAIADPAKRAEQATKLFGLESATAGNILLDNVARIEEFTAKVTGTNVAYEQQAKNTATVNAALAKLRNAWADVVLSFESSTGVIRDVVLFLADNLKAIFVALGTVVGALTAYFLATRAVAAVTALYRGYLVVMTVLQLRYGTATAASTLATRALSVAMRAVPILALVSALALAAEKLGFFKISAEEAATANDKLNESRRQTLKTEQELNRATRGIEAQYANLSKLNEDQARQLLQTIDQQIQAIDAQGAKAIEAEAKSSAEIEAIRARRAQRIAEIEAQLQTEADQGRRFDLSLELDALRSSESEKREVRRTINTAITADDAAAAKQRLLGTRAEVEARIKELQRLSGADPEAVNAGTIKALEKRQQDLRKKLSETLRIGSPEFFKVRDEFIQVSKELADAQALLSDPKEAPLKGSVAFLEREVTRLKEQLSGLPEDAQGIDAVREALFATEDKLAELKKRLFERPDDEGTKDALLSELDERERHQLALFDIEQEGNLVRARNAQASDEELARIEADGNRRRLEQELAFARERLEILLNSLDAEEEEVTRARNAVAEIEARLKIPAIQTTEAKRSVRELVDEVTEGAAQIAQAGAAAWRAWGDAQAQMIDRQIQQEEARIEAVKDLAERGNAVLYEEEKKRLRDRPKPPHRRSLPLPGQQPRAAAG